MKGLEFSLRNMSTSAHDRDDPGKSSKAETEENVLSMQKEGEKKDAFALNSTNKQDNFMKESLLIGRRSKPKLVSAQAVLSSRLENEPIQEEPVMTLQNVTGTPVDTESNTVLNCSETSATDVTLKETGNERNADEKLTESGEMSKKSMWRAGQRERWKVKRKENLGESVINLLENEAAEKEMNHGIRWRHIQKHCGSKERLDEESEKEDRAGERWQGSMEGDPETRGAVPHHVFSRVLVHSFTSSSSSSSSSFNCSSAESDEVFSEGEEVAKRKEVRRCRSWRTFLTMMQWSKRRQSSWIQIAGHQGNIQLGEGGEVWKRFNEVEDRCLQALMSDPLRQFVPQYYGNISRNGESYIRLQDLLSGLKQPVIMDCKMGIRTYQEEEIIKARTKSSLRTDMYQKMVKVDPTAPTEEEHEHKGVTKLRYMQWRDSTSSTSTLGFRIEGIMMENGVVLRNFNKTRSKSQVTDTLLFFTKKQIQILKSYESRLEALKDTLKESAFFSSHEIIGGSLLFVHDHTGKANIWMIDFGKTMPGPENVGLKHDIPWVEGNHEDGYLIGLDSLISLLHEAIREAMSQNLERQNVQTNEKDTERLIQPGLRKIPSDLKETSTNSIDTD